MSALIRYINRLRRRREHIPFDFSGLPKDRRILCEMAGILLHKRLSMHITARELASMVGVPVRVITSLEHANPHTLQFLCRVADALNCDFEITEKGRH